MRDSLDARSGLVVAGAALLLLSLFLDWYEPGITAWTAFELVDVLLLAGAVLAVVAVLPGGPPGLRRALPWIGGALFLVVLVNVVDPPPAAAGTDRELGAALALVASALLAAGALLALFGVSLRIDVQSRPAPAAPPAAAAETTSPAGRTGPRSLFGRDQGGGAGTPDRPVPARPAPPSVPSPPPTDPPATGQGAVRVTPSEDVTQPLPRDEA